jgi:hypothetical protein
MSEMNLITGKSTLAFASVVEVGTGLVLVVVPALVVSLLLGLRLSADGMPIARVAGIALLALGLACWPSRQGSETASAPFRGMVVYNALIALYLAHLGALRHLAGLLLWPAVALHAVVALLLLWTWRNERRARATNA